MQKSEESYQIREDIKNIIAHALLNVVFCQLKIYFSLLYGMVSLKAIIRGVPGNDTFAQKIQWPNGATKIEYLPRIAAPTSCVIFWMNYLGLQQHSKEIKRFEKIGYSSPQQIRGELEGYYEFYAKERSGCIIIFILFVFHIYVFFTCYY